MSYESDQAATDARMIVSISQEITELKAQLESSYASGSSKEHKDFLKDCISSKERALSLYSDNPVW